jgi:ribosomal RNA assembly protein
MIFTNRVKIPTDRIGVLIGKDGKVKKRIESACNTSLKIDGETGEVEFSTPKELIDPTVVFKIQNIITAIGRGFPPWKALKLLDDDFMFEVIDLRNAVGKSRRNLQRVKGRLIGNEGKTRKIIEETTDVDVSIYGRTLALIGRASELEVAKAAIDKLIGGCEHKTVYRFLSYKRHEIKKERIKLWES